MVWKSSKSVLLKGLGCEELVKRDTPDKLQQRSVKYVEFFEKNLITQEVNRRAIDLEEIQYEDTSPSEITSELPMEVEDVEEHSLRDLNEPTSYKAAMLDSDSNKWIDAMNAEIQSMMDNMVWVLVDLPPGCKTVGSKWILKKKTDMDGIIHTYKARLVGKSYTQLYEVDYEETFSPVADIRAIRILISIAAYYDYEIWKMDIKTAFLNGYLDEDIYMVQHEGFVDPNHPRKTAVKNILKYLRNTKDMFLVYGGNPEAELRVDCYCNAGFETDIDDMKSQNMICFHFEWRRTEIEAVWIRKFILRLGIVPTINEPIRVFCDNSAALYYANEPGVQRGARQYHWRYHYVHESIALGEIRFLKVHTDDNLADPFMKALSKGKLTQHARSMGLRLASSFR
ncbi:retrotransposon protein, putative, ty1-copia subclass [Tanacetum coccineum]